MNKSILKEIPESFVKCLSEQTNFILEVEFLDGKAHVGLRIGGVLCEYITMNGLLVKEIGKVLRDD